MNGPKEFPKLSVIIPAYNEEKNLPVLYKRLCEALQKDNLAWEAIIIDDHSPDNTFYVIQELTRKDHRIRGIRLARNSGSDTAIMCGLSEARGECAVFLAADLQDPPEVILNLLAAWRTTNADVIGASRAKREGQSFLYMIGANVFYYFIRNIIGISEIPKGGADYFLVDRKVIEALLQFSEGNMCISFLIPWLGFKQKYITYTKNSRLHGKTSWTVEKIVKRIIDSITFFSYLPLRVISYVGFTFALIGFVYAIVVLILGIRGTPIPGWASLMIAILVLGGIQMLMMGALGEYLWRALDVARKRPLFLIEQKTDRDAYFRQTDGKSNMSLEDQPSSGQQRQPHDIENAS